MGPIGPEVATAICGSFSMQRPARALPDAWSVITPERAVVVRGEAAAAALRQLAPEIDQVAVAADESLGDLVDGLAPAGRPLGAANMAVATSEDPVARLWQRCTTLREHRGDAHVAALVAAELGGCAADVVATARHGWEPDLLKISRAWTDEEWAGAVDRLRARGVLESDPVRLELSARGAVLHDRVEARTDALAADSYRSVGADALDGLDSALAPIARQIGASGVIRYPNPIGLDRPDP